jgi:SNW domain-containing protein 1
MTISTSATPINLPAPKYNNNTNAISTQRQNTASSSSLHGNNNTKTNVRRVPPSYEERCQLAIEASRGSKSNKPFIPRTLEDFDDGGAFPEIPMAQYPRNMGNPHHPTRQSTTTTTTTGGDGKSNSIGNSNINNSTADSYGRVSSSRAIVNVEIDENGQVSYDAIVKRGTNSDKLVYTSLEDTKERNPIDISLPTKEEEEQTRIRTQAALQSRLSMQLALDKPSGSARLNAETSQNIEQKTQFIQYKPRPDAPGYNPAAATRVIQMVPAQVDPMMPPKHRHIKAPRGPAEDFVPVLHGPPPKLTQEEKQAWNIPACISNWKNARGYTIPLDKRLAADGRGLRSADDMTISPHFATLSESLYVAEQQARHEVRLRAQVQAQLAAQERQKREDELRQLAQQARQRQHQQQPPPSLLPNSGQTNADANLESETNRTIIKDSSDSDDNAAPDGDDDNHIRNTSQDNEEMAAAARQRDRLRMERRKERERELRMEQNNRYGGGTKQSNLTWESHRDISEPVALGSHPTPALVTTDQDVDARLYHQSAGLDSGFARDDDDDYQGHYTKPLFTANVGTSLYRPTRDGRLDADDTHKDLLQRAATRFQSETSSSTKPVATSTRSGPVQFERPDSST